MTIRSVGFDGVVGEVDWSAWLAPYLGAPAGVRGGPDFKVTSTPGMAVQVAPGIAQAHGVVAWSDTAEVLTLTPPTSGSRWDCVVLRRDWTGRSITPSGVETGGQSSLAVVPGGTAKAVPALTASVGVGAADQALALVKVTAGATSPTEVEDLRVTWTRPGYARSVLAMTGQVGTRYLLEPENGRRYVVGPSGPVPEWEPVAPVIPDVPIVNTGTDGVTFDATGAGRIYHTLGRRPKHVLVAARSTASSTLVDVTLTTQSGAINEKFFAVNAKVVQATAPGWKPYQGNLSQVEWVAIG